MSYARYLSSVALIAVVLAVLSFSFSAMVDPFGIFAAYFGDHSRLRRTEAADFAREAKLAITDRLEPRAVILGSSTAFVGLPAAYDGWQVRPVYNLAVGGATIGEIEWLLRYVSERGQVRKVVLQLDFYMFNMRNAPRMTPPRHGGAAALERYFDLIGSSTAVLAGLETLMTQHSPGCEVVLSGDELCAPEGIVVKGGYRRAFLGTEESYLTTNAWFAQGQGFDFRDGSGQSAFDVYARILQYAARQGLELYIVLSPSHARMWAALRLAGLYDGFLLWKRRLADIDLALAKADARATFPLWDFSYANRFTTEPIPQDARLMEFYLETAHFTPKLGAIVLGTVLDGKVEPTFGMRLDVGEPAAAIAAAERLQQEWEAESGAQLDDLRLLARRSAAYRARLFKAGRIVLDAGPPGRDIQVAALR